MELPAIRPKLALYIPYLYCVALLAAAGISHFAVLSNDSFPLRWQAQHLSLWHPESFYNAFFPIGYPALLRIVLTFSDAFTPLLLVQILCTVFYARKAFECSGRFLGPSTSILAGVLILFSPDVIRAAMSVVPDFFAGLLALLAYVALSNDDDDRSDRRAGIYLGISSLFRTHAVALLLALTVALIILEREILVRRLKQIWMGALPFILLQGAIQLWSGHGFFENGQAFNIWKTIHGVDWTNPPVPFTLSTWKVITNEPIEFLRSYLAVLVDQALAIIPLLIVLADYLIRRKTSPRLATLALTGLLYVLLTSAGGSARAPLLILPITIISLFWLIRNVFPTGMLREQTVKWITTALVSSIAAIALVFIFFGAIKASKRIESYGELQQGLHLTQKQDVNRIYSDDFALYFPKLSDVVPKTTGGWAELGLPDYLKSNPHIHDSSAATFRSDLLRDSITTLVFRNPPISIKALQLVQSDTVHFARDTAIRSYTVIRLR